MFIVNFENEKEKLQPKEMKNILEIRIYFVSQDIGSQPLAKRPKHTETRIQKSGRRSDNETTPTLRFTSQHIVVAENLLHFQ